MAALLASYMNCMSLPRTAPHNRSTHQTQSALVSLLYCPIAASIAELASAVPASGGGKEAPKHQTGYTEEYETDSPQSIIGPP